MHLNHRTNREQALTLLEIILVVVVVAILAGLVLPLSSRQPPARIAQARTEMTGLIAAINQYETIYSKFPLPGNYSATNHPPNFTFGTFGTSASTLGITNATSYQANNSEVMAALMDLTKFPNGKDTLNSNHSLNPQKMSFLNVRMAHDTNSHGFGPDGVYRDPWGNPYIITIHLNADNKCRDPFYSLASVSEIAPDQATGLNQLTRPTPPPYPSAETRNSFEAPARIMVWSLGPDGKADPAKKANAAPNKDNITSW